MAEVVSRLAAANSICQNRILYPFGSRIWNKVLVVTGYRERVNICCKHKNKGVKEQNFDCVLVDL